MQQLKPVLSAIGVRYGTPAHGLAADFTEASSPTCLIQRIEQSIGPVDILLNVNSGLSLTSFVYAENVLAN
jgi:hypothetical protein